MNFPLYLEMTTDNLLEYKIEYNLLIIYLSIKSLLLTKRR